MKVLFFGSDILAVPSLERLALGSHHEIAAVVGRPDMPAGRGLKMTPTPVISRARKLGLKVFQPEKLSHKHLSEALSLDWQVGVVIGYREIIPSWLIENPTRVFINVHPSLLPRYRGAAPIERAILDGVTITGVTSILLSDRVDAGDILLQAEEPIYPDDNAGTLRDRLALVARDLLISTLDGVESGTLKPIPQEEEKATTAPPLSVEEARIDWSLPADRIDRLVRALNPDVGAYTFFRGKRIKIWSVRIAEITGYDEPGCLIEIGKAGVFVTTGTNCLEILVLQLEGKRRMTGSEFSRGARLKVGERFWMSPSGS